MLGGWIGDTDHVELSPRAMVILSTMIGAMVLARAVNDTDLARGFLDTAADQVRAVAAAKASGARRATAGKQRLESRRKASLRRRE
jgi:TetR/AcrR family transcriptional repressor of nem operon